MKVAFHFYVIPEAYRGSYGQPIKELFFKSILNSPVLNICSVIFVGDLLLHLLAETQENHKSGFIRVFHKEKFSKIVNIWYKDCKSTWHKLNSSILEIIFTNRIYVICLDDISLRDSEYLNKILSETQSYLGALQVNEDSPIHWSVYTDNLMPIFRISGRSINLFWDGVSSDSYDAGLIDWLGDIGFEDVSLEDINGKFTGFDKNYRDEFERQIAKLNKILETL